MVNIADTKDNPMIKIKHDGQIAIATGSSAKTKQWKNKTFQWSELVEKIRHTTRTPETSAEYKKMSKAEKGNIKDVGGFVGGSLKNGRRLNTNVQNRTLLTLDLDYVVGDVWSSIELLWDFSCIMYSTHTHSPDNQRLRLVIPLSRPVLPDEYQAISRMVADDLGIDQFDDTTYEPSRLMYWPSTSSDGEYVFKVQDLSWLNPDEILARYTFGWQDVSYWPESSRARAKLNSAIKKQEDPLEKKGVIGAFCRTYSISEAIAEFLPNVYTAGADETRYTFAEGSTSGGLIIYEDKFSFSHHGTDPTSGMLCNAFDLVRIHKFGELDEDVRSDTKSENVPSFKSMKEFAAKDNKVMQDMINRNTEKAKEDFEPIEGEWLKDLEFNGNTEKFKTTSKNFKLIMENDPNIKGKILFDEFGKKIIVKAQLPWRKKDDFEEWEDNDDSSLRNYIEDTYKIRNKEVYNDSISEIINKNSFHPIKKYLNTLKWDGGKRIETLFIDYFGVEDNIFVRAFTKKWLCGAIKRILEPGCKFDYMLVLVGNQGVKKSTFFRKLAKDYFTDSIQDVNGKQAIELIQGVWIVEFGELQAFSRSDNEAIKRFTSATEDKYRPAYGRHTVNAKRQCVFAGTTNKAEFLTDKTGNRRYWILDCTDRKEFIKKDVFKELNKELDQVWAETIYILKQGIDLYPTKEEEEYLSKYQENYNSIDDVEQVLLDRLDWKAPKEKWKDFTYTDLVVALGLNDRQRKYARNNLKSILTNMGVSQMKETAGNRRRVYNIPPFIIADF